MDIFKLSERLMSMDDEAWARHANPSSVYSRFSCLPLIALAIWSRDWFGWWSLALIALAIFWTWLNPRIFDQAESKDSWAYKGVMGERIFLNRRIVAIPDHHQSMAYFLTALSAVGVLILLYGLYQLNLWATLCGMFAAVGAKTWFVDRMVWLYSDMSDMPDRTNTGA